MNLITLSGRGDTAGDIPKVGFLGVESKVIIIQSLPSGRRRDRYVRHTSYNTGFQDGCSATSAVVSAGNGLPGFWSHQTPARAAVLTRQVGSSASSLVLLTCPSTATSRCSRRLTIRAN